MDMHIALTMFALLPLSLLLEGCDANNAMADTYKATIETPSHSARTSVEHQRDQYRHPAQTLQFFDVQPDHTVVEIWPGSGWYSAILAPYLRNKGKFIAAHWPHDSKVEFFRKTREQYDQRFTKHRDVYGSIDIVELEPPTYMDLGEAGQADRVLTFRNVHNWMRTGQEQAVFDAAHVALKRGGMLGVVEHRAPQNFTREQMIESGYVSEAYVTELAINAGFEPFEHSEINANPNDTHLYPAGVWTLPPTLRLGDQDREKYLAIGESDRMTLSFRKP
jgi:predicted methyltransferase